MSACRWRTGVILSLDHEKGETGSRAVRVEALDLLRLVAVLGVVLFHYGFRGPTAHDVAHVALPDLAWLARYGFLGVPIFFVISGFVIAYSAEGRTATGFAIARFARIYPTFAFCMTLTFVATLVLGAPHFETSMSQWAANLFIAAPALGHPYMDSAYWSLVDEVIFYAWVTFWIATRLFPRRIDAIVLVWIGGSLLNEMTIDASWICKLFLADSSGFFATGLLIYEFYKGRRDAALQCLLAASISTAVFQAVHNLGKLRDQSGGAFDDWIVAAICLASILVIIQATPRQTDAASSRRDRCHRRANVSALSAASADRLCRFQMGGPGRMPIYNDRLDHFCDSAAVVGDMALCGAARAALYEGDADCCRRATRARQSAFPDQASSPNALSQRKKGAGNRARHGCSFGYLTQNRLMAF